MRFQIISAAVLASISSVFAQTAGFDAMSIPKEGQVMTVGDVMDITWAPNGVAGKVTIKLLEGASPSSLSYDPVLIASSIDNLDGHYKWTIPESVGSFATYGIGIILDSDQNTFQWSFPFKINAAASASASASSAATSTTEAAFTSISGIPGGCNPAHPGSCPSSYFSTATAAASTTEAAFSSISGIPGGCNPAHPGSCPSSYFSTATSAAATATATASSNGTVSNITTAAGPGVVQTTGGAVSNLATGSIVLFGGLVAAFFL
ncbi:hypothetical protein NHQ30_010639 [Ciborinia camelliae]|nr:hypothetical protein NHQ30_010639 [Ciborinia camelliae]